MECHEARRILSERLDGEPVSEAERAEANLHCRACPECTAFASALMRLDALTPPEPPADLPDRIMDAVRAEAVSAARTPLPAEPEPVAAPASRSVPAAAEPGALERLLAIVTARRNRRAVVAWSTGLGLLLVASVTVAVAGIARISGSDSTGVTKEMAVESAPSTAPQAQEDTGAGDLAGTAPQTSAAAPPSAITVSGVVYLSTGVVSDIETATLTPMGSTRSALSAQGAPLARQVVGLGDPERVYVVDDDGQIIGFERVTREFRGHTYVLKSADLLTFGTWPALPSGVEQPTNANGTPEYIATGTDDLGVEVYRPASGDTSAGFLIAPGTSTSDPAGGNPNWTWWAPAR